MRFAVHLLGFLVAFAFLAAAVWKGSGDLPELAWGSPGLWIPLLAAFGLYVVSQLLAAIAWAGTLAIFSVRLPPKRAATQLLVSQIGKYIPGNVAHFFGRLALARADGVPGTVVGLALLVEIGFVLSAGGLLLSALLLMAPDIIQPMLPDTSSATQRRFSIAAAFALGACVALCCWIVFRKTRLKSGTRAFDLSQSLVPLTLHLVNFVILGLSLAFAVQAVAPASGAGLFLPMSVFVAAWTIGFLTPGAPGGIGIREGLIVLGLGLAIGDGSALATALLHRALAVLGDLATFLIGILLRSGRPTTDQDSSR